jgi:Family of unknown function (DUF6220)
LHDLTASVGRPAAALPSRLRVARRAYRLLAHVLVLCVVVQAVLAGLALFVDHSWWVRHRAFGHLPELLLPLMLVAAFVGRLPSRTRSLTAAALGLTVIQGVTAALGGPAGVVHPANALLIFWAATSLARAERATESAGVDP